VVDTQAVARELGLAGVSLINDLEANAYGIAALQPADVVVLKAGAPNASGNAAVIAAGTGLGEAGLYWDGQWHHPFACEGGHCDFAPRNELESDLLAYLRRRYGRASYERVLSGPGLVNIFEFLRDNRLHAVAPSLAEELEAGNPGVTISRHGLAGHHEICVHALDLMVSFYGAEAGNLALKILATGGVWLGGGIAPQILPKLQSPVFLDAFLDKGRMKPLLDRIPIHVILNDKTALLGAARCAARRGKLL
jgi:glucokinase